MIAKQARGSRACFFQKGPSESVFKPEHNDMSYSVWLSVLLNSTAAIAIAFIVPRVSLNQPALDTEKLPTWIFVLGSAMVLLAGKKLFSMESSIQESLHALLLSVAALGGIALKWALSIAASRARSLHERSLLNSLLFSPIGMLWVRAVSPETGFFALAACWFLTGFFWQTIFDDGSRFFAKQPGV